VAESTGCAVTGRLKRFWDGSRKKRSRGNPGSALVMLALSGLIVADLAPFVIGRNTSRSESNTRSCSCTNCRWAYIRTRRARTRRSSR
jgi:hypothetical protein